MLNKDQIREIITAVKAKFPTLLSETRTNEHCITGEMVTKMVLSYLWSDHKDKIIMPDDMNVMVLHKFQDIPMDSVFMKKEFGQINLENCVTIDRAPAQFPEVEKENKFLISTKSEPVVVLLMSKEEESSNLTRCHIVNEPWETILTVFNLNALQVGIDLFNESIHYTPDFEKFVNDKQLYVTNIIQPTGALLDLVIMANTLPCYCDLKEEFGMLAQTYYYHEVTHLVLDVVDYKHYQKANSYFPNLFKYFTYKKDKALLIPKSDILPKELRLMKIASEAFTFILNYWKIYKRSTNSKAAKEKFDAIFEHYRLSYYLLSNPNYYDFKKQPVLLEMKHLDAMLKKHENLNKLIADLNLHDQLRFCETIRDFMRQYDEWVIGYLETNDKKFKNEETGEIDYEKITKLLEDEVKRLNEPLIETLDIREFKYRSYVDELYTPLKLQVEGKRMHHCVGGYSNQVQSGDSRIFHIETDRATVSTLELRVREAGDRLQFEVKQHKNISNTAPDDENEEIASELVKFLNKKYGV